MGIEKYTSTICPKIEEKLEVNKARDCFAHFAGEFKFEVDCHDQTYMVDLKAMTCGCRMWDLIGIPCMHAVSAITLNKQKPDEYIHPCYTRDTYLNVYKYMINPIPGKHDWVETSTDPIQPPVMSWEGRNCMWLEEKVQVLLLVGEEEEEGAGEVEGEGDGSHQGQPEVMVL
ncbi:hypothetical protein Vadar_020101 [Vaccinium darrowii]|uniref:Uncharacterized protein n=1 Tax=Vaccinium darrowii TaxID=229202 RepID=A0ACB7XIQ9_9ERIC|nr:hypothetical protein Vadar_020101 [Vaccinium darrowii]